MAVEVLNVVNMPVSIFAQTSQRIVEGLLSPSSNQGVINVRAAHKLLNHRRRPCYYHFVNFFFHLALENNMHFLRDIDIDIACCGTFSYYY